MRVWFAVQCFSRVLFDADFARRIRQQTGATPVPPEGEEKPAPVAPLAARTISPRSDAIALLAALQREARFVDIVSESLDGYSDAQIGAAARDVLRDSGKVLNRLFALERVVDAEEGHNVEIPAGYDTGRYHLTGNVSRQPPLMGQLLHAGWQATKCEMPAWTGSRQTASIVAPAEVQVD